MLNEPGFDDMKGIKQKTIKKTFIESMGDAATQYDVEMDCPSPFLSRVVGADPPTHTIKMERMTCDLLHQIQHDQSINHSQSTTEIY
tara:strand:+ start:12623 stop:12883 length:261 start_codon:yes stop_codon:yes gene_type:complete